ncbi:MAG TPA: arylformamidase [Symbiobacteriaceae bacterium]|jgi:arylformamidase
MKLYDITHALGNDTAYWPGDSPFRLEPTARIAGGSSVNLSALTLSPHNGTHTDAPFHYDDRGLTMERVSLEPYLGRAVVVALEGRPAVTAADLQALNIGAPARVLIRTGSCPDRTRFYPDFTYLEPGAIEYLATLGCRLVGTDAHSVDPFDSKDLRAHHACFQTGMIILENLNLTAVEPGEYELIALPLKLEGGDGSPVRAVLRSLA